MAFQGEDFLRSVRRHFASLFDEFGFRELQAKAYPYTHAVLVAKSPTHYFRIVGEFRDDDVYACLGRLVEGVVPPTPIAPSRSVAAVREISQAFPAWLATGDRDAAFAIGAIHADLDATVKRVAEAWETYGRRVLEGDEDEWNRAAELMVTREWKSR